MNNDYTQLRWWKKHKLQNQEKARLPIILTRKYKIKRIFYEKYENR